MAMWLTIALLFWFVVWGNVVIEAGELTMKHSVATLVMWFITGWVPVLLFKLFG